MNDMSVINQTETNKTKSFCLREIGLAVEDQSESQITLNC